MSEIDRAIGGEDYNDTEGERAYEKAYDELAEYLRKKSPQESLNYDGLKGRLATLGPALDVVIRGNASDPPSETGVYRFATKLDYARHFVAPEITLDQGSLIGMTDGAVVSLFQGPWIDHDPLVIPDPHRPSPESTFLTIPAVADGWNNPYEVPSIKVGDEDTQYPGRNRDSDLLQLLYERTFGEGVQGLLWSARFPEPDLETEHPHEPRIEPASSLVVPTKPGNRHVGERRPFGPGSFNLRNKGRHNRT